MNVQLFEASLQLEDNQAVIQIRGELDYATAPILQNALNKAIAAGSCDVVLDFNDVTFLDSEGLKILILAHRELSERGGTLSIKGCSRFVAKTFEILGMDVHFGVNSTAK